MQGKSTGIRLSLVLLFVACMAFLLLSAEPRSPLTDQEKISLLNLTAKADSASAALTVHLNTLKQSHNAADCQLNRGMEWVDCQLPNTVMRKGK